MTPIFCVSGFSDWHSWDKTGYFAPKSTHAPVAHAMDTNMFNGRINVFIHGTDGKIHHIWQTTCDKVPNPWGWCTWSTWNTIGETMPIVMNVANTLSIANNMHLGIEVKTQNYLLFVGFIHIYEGREVDNNSYFSEANQYLNSIEHSRYYLKN